MASSLKTIQQPIAAELDVFEKRFRKAMKSKVPLLDMVTGYIVQRKGKQIRPTFVLLAAKLLGEINDKTYSAASMVELLHTATLVHDDVVDDADKRRGFFSINGIWKNKIAVLVGDYLLSRGLLLSLENKHFDVLEIVARAVQQMSEGELLQIEKARKLDIQEDIYFEIITKKTASLIASACACGAASVVDDEEGIEKMRLLGETIGIAFQIKDDLLDYSDDEIGKPKGIDIKERKMTLPLIYTLDHCSWREKRFIKSVFKRHNTNKDKVNEVIELVKKSGGIPYTEGKMQEYLEKSLNLLNQYPNNEARQGLEELIQFTISRKK